MYDPRYTDDLFRPGAWDDYYELERRRRREQDLQRQMELQRQQQEEQRRLEEEARKRNEEWKQQQGANLGDKDWGGILSQLSGMMGGGQQQSAAPMPSAPSVPIPTAQITTQPMEAVFNGFEEPLIARLLGLSGQR